MIDKTALQRSLQQVVHPGFLALLLCADTLFLGLHIVNKLRTKPNDLFWLNTEGGFPEFFQYVKEYWLALLLLLMCWKTREIIFGAWALLFANLLCDDAQEIHERLGAVVAEGWSYRPALGLRAQDFGELTVSLFAGIILLSIVAAFYARSSANAKNASKDLLILLMLLVFFGIVLDMMHVELERFPIPGMVFIEDGGEMLIVSVMASYAAQMLNRDVHVPGLIWQFVVSPLKRTFDWYRRTNRRIF